MTLHCDLCKAELGVGRPWILLNRYIVGDGRLRRSCSFDEWEHQGSATAEGHLLCLSPCFATWIDGQLIAGNVELDKQEGT